MESFSVPNFFLVGAPKAGTTSFLRYLEQHPSVFVSPIKEPSFFAPEILDFRPDVREGFCRDREALRAYLDQSSLDRRKSGIVLEWDQYVKLFKGVRHETAIGEGSVCYLGTPSSASAIRTRLPGARILMILRDPADRLRSYWAAALASGATTGSFMEWMDEQIEIERPLAPPLGPVWTGFYATQVKRFFETFSANQVKLIFYEDYVRDRQATLREAFAFLKVDAGWVADVSRRHNVAVVPRWPRLHRLTRPVRCAVRFALPGPIVSRMRDQWRQPFHPVLSVRDRAKAIAVYSDDIRALAALLHRDLSSWLDPHTSP